MLDAWPCAATDGRAVVTAPHAAAGVLRWAVVDRDRNVAPIWDPQRHVLFVGDVRLYNRSDLQRELGLDAGAQERTDLDLAWSAYSRWGENAPSHLIGDFAFAAWHEKERTIFAATDHFAVRQLYHRVGENQLALASGVEQLLALSPDCAHDIDAGSILSRYTWQPRLRGHTFFRSVSSLPGGHVAEIKFGRCRSRRFWFPPENGVASRSHADNCAEIRHLFRQAVRDRIEADRPIVAHSSGGVDSSAIVIAADEIYAEGGRRPPLVTAAALTPGMPCDDSRYMDAVARRVRFEGVRWNALEPTPVDLGDQSLGQPGLRRGAGGGPRRDLMLARERGARVLLSGMGGDGITYSFGIGRDMVRHGFWARFVRDVLRGRSPSAAVRQTLRSALGFLPPPVALRVLDGVSARRAANAPRWIGPALRSIYPAPREPLDLPPGRWPSHMACENWARITSAQGSNAVAATVQYGSRDGIEVRVPFADVRLVEKVLSIPWRDRLPRNGDFRSIGRDALGPLLPPEFEQRIDQGSWAEVWAMSARRMLPKLDAMLNEDEWLSAPYVEKTEARSMLREVIGQASPAHSKSLILVSEFAVLEAWLRKVFRYDTRHEVS